LAFDTSSLTKNIAEKLGQLQEIKTKVVVIVLVVVPGIVVCQLLFHCITSLDFNSVGRTFSLTATFKQSGANEFVLAQMTVCFVNRSTFTITGFTSHKNLLGYYYRYKAASHA